MAERGSGGGVSLSLYGSSVKGTWRVAGYPRGWVEKALDMGISFHRDPPGEPGRGSSTRDFERWMKWALGMERFSLKKLSVEDLWGGGLLYWGPCKIC